MNTLIILGIVYLLVQLGVAMLFPAAAWILFASLGLSLLSILFYAIDKAMAGKGGSRVPEKHLHVLALFGGWPGAAVAQGLFRHKTQKPAFRATYRVVVGVNILATALLCWILASGS